MKLVEDGKIDTTTHKRFLDELTEFQGVVKNDPKHPPYSIFQPASIFQLIDHTKIHAVLTPYTSILSLEAFAVAFIQAMYDIVKLEKLKDYKPSYILQGWTNAQQRCQKMHHVFEIRAPVQVVNVADYPERDNLTRHVEKTVLATDTIKAGRILGFYDGKLNYSRDLEKELQVTNRYERERYAFPFKYFEAKKPLDTDIDQDFVVEAIREDNQYYSWIWEVNDVAVMDLEDDPYNRDPLSFRDSNVFRMELVCFGWPYIFLVAYKDIQSGEEILLNYHDDFAEQWQYRDDQLIHDNLLVPINEVVKNEVLYCIVDRNAHLGVNTNISKSPSKPEKKSGTTIPKTPMSASQQALLDPIVALHDAIEKVRAVQFPSIVMPLMALPTLSVRLDYERDAMWIEDEADNPRVVGASSPAKKVKVENAKASLPTRLVERKLRRRLVDEK
ncbi:UNVERIFIED_CONTAM: hypothetical protein HDU68_011045 [Siphonaria sp. JEL0065]|nr:hypothetical protein HDU68_011045 [Siphonaria sp. JEL0065]